MCEHEVVDRATWQAELDALRIREKAHTREGDAIAAARRRLPIVEVDPAITLIGPHGPITLMDAFEGRRRPGLPHERASHRPVVPPGGRTLRRPRHRRALKGSQ
jgi:Bacterial protein of unknown function (DUF899)